MSDFGHNFITLSEKIIYFFISSLIWNRSKKKKSQSTHSCTHKVPSTYIHCSRI